MPDKAGLYLHIPFCEKKCAYCDFYSAFGTDSLIDEYIIALEKEIVKWGGLYNRPIDTVYIGGGTPSLIGERIEGLLDTVKRSFNVCDGAEITAEVNPSSTSESFLLSAKKAGVNRLSVGVQSGNDGKLKLLGRTHTSKEARLTVETARRLGFSNISVDFMTALPNETEKEIDEDIEFMLSLEPEHISSYMLKVEPNTRFAFEKSFVFPTPEEQAQQYLAVCTALENHGYRHYEISNFAKTDTKAAII